MTNILLGIIITFEIIRLIVYLQDSVRIRSQNKRVEEYQKLEVERAKIRDAEWKLIRKAEVEELRQLAKESDTMKEIYDEWVKNHKDEAV